MDQNTKDLICLCVCAINGTVPDHVDRMDLDGIYSIAERHLLSALISFPLRDAGVKDGRTASAIAKAERKAAILENEKAALFKRLEQEGIWYMPIKGAVLKDYYPEFGMREMSDYDILYDASRSDDLKRVMEDLGFSTERFNSTSNHDVFFKKPLANFEMHRSLFGVFIRINWRHTMRTSRAG